MTRFLALAMTAGLLFALAGCRHSCWRQPWCGTSAPAPAPLYVPPAPPPPPPPAFQQSGGFPNLPPGAVLNPPPGAKIAQPGLPPSISNSPPVKNTPPKESTEPPVNRNVPPGVRLYAPEALQPPQSQKPQATLPPIAQFGVAKDNVYAGVRPSPTGFDWLRDNRIAMVVHLRAPGTDDAAHKKQVEERGMRYRAIDVSPQTLTKETSDQFIAAIRHGAKQGVFVYDQDGSLAGAMWYLYFRAGEFLDADASQLRARQLGLDINRDRDLWLAVRGLLRENKP